jgi:hypothetical protein
MDPTPNGHREDVLYAPPRDLLEHPLAVLQKREADGWDVSIPSVDEVLEMIRAAFWASLARDETRAVLPRVGYFSAKSSLDYRFLAPIPLTAPELSRLANTLPPRGVAAVTRDAATGRLSIWGVARSHFDAIVIEAIAPAVLIVRAGHPEVLLERERASIIDRTMRERARDLLDGVEVAGENGSVRGRNILLSIARAVARLGHGGAILVVPAGSAEWRAQIKPTSRDAAEPYGELSRRSKQFQDALVERDRLRSMKPRDTEKLRHASEWLDTVMSIQRTMIDDVALLANIDGALVIDTNLNVRSFGAKIDAPATKEIVRVVWPLRDQPERRARIDAIGGMRHQSAANFVAAMPGLSAVVISQDGPMSVFGREGSEIVQLKGVEFLGI